MPNKCDYCPTAIDWRKDTWIERHTPGKPVESAHEDCYLKHRFLVKSPGKVPVFSQHVSTHGRGRFTSRECLIRAEYIRHRKFALAIGTTVELG